LRIFGFSSLIVFVRKNILDLLKSFYKVFICAARDNVLWIGNRFSKLHQKAQNMMTVFSIQSEI